ncbi:MAG: dephospho-CoA kinase [Treponema sp.]|nr:dephospho-CoA kinase [Treponema sp.]
MIIGLTGLYCAGKNHVSLLLERHGLPVLDIDRLGHEIIEAETEKITGHFGKEILDPNGVINRKLLGKIVFGKPEQLAVLESIVHPGVNRLTEEWITGRKLGKISGQETGTCVINAALLHKSSVINKLNVIIVVCAPFYLRFFRALRRDKRPPWELINQLLSQKDFPHYRKTAGRAEKTSKTAENPAQLFFPEADIYTIQNSGFSGSPRMLEKQIEAILEGFHNGKEKIIVDCSFSGSSSGNHI